MKLAKALDLPPLWWATSVLAIYLCARYLPHLNTTHPAQPIIGTIIVICSVGLILWSAVWFRRKNTTIHPGHKASTLITEGPFTWSRNPIYLAMVTSALGITIYAGHFPAVLLVILLWIVLDRRFARPEEIALARAFGKDAKHYIHTTPRWIWL